MARSRRAQQQDVEDITPEREIAGGDDANATIEDGMASLFAELQASNALRSDDDEAAGEVDESATFVLLTELDRLWQRAA